MFTEPLQKPEDNTYRDQLMTLYDAYIEFDSYCTFLHMAHEAIVAQAELHKDYVVGIGMSGQCLVDRSDEIKQQLEVMLANTQAASA